MAEARKRVPNPRRRRAFGKLDPRTNETRWFKTYRAELTEYVGGNPTVVQQVLIERAAWLRVRLLAIDTKASFGKSAPSLSKYTVLSSTLARLVSQLAPATAQSNGDPIGSYVRDRYEPADGL
jgi:hypothetical protein